MEIERVNPLGNITVKINTYSVVDYVNDDFNQMAE